MDDIVTHLDDILDQLSGARLFINLDLRSVYHRIRIKFGDTYVKQLQDKEMLVWWTVM